MKLVIVLELLLSSNFKSPFCILFGNFVFLLFSWKSNMVAYYNFLPVYQSSGVLSRVHQWWGWSGKFILGRNLAIYPLLQEISDHVVWMSICFYCTWFLRNNFTYYDDLVCVYLFLSFSAFFIALSCNVKTHCQITSRRDYLLKRKAYF